MEDKKDGYPQDFRQLTYSLRVGMEKVPAQRSSHHFVNIILLPVPNQTTRSNFFANKMMFTE